MSFKRDGDDENLLKNLNHQRVKELLGSHIPQDEAKLLNNGRLTCTICIHRPIFDTINMLAIHRRGKRHMLELGKYIKCKEKAVIKDLQRRRDPLADHTGDAESKHGRDKAAKQSFFKARRKPVLEMPVLTKKVMPKTSCSNTNTKSATATVRHYLKSISRKSSLEKVVEKNRENYGADLVKEKLNKDSTVPAVDSGNQKLSETNSCGSETQTKTVSNNASLDYEMKLRMSGWVKDSSGQWIKDPNVEFDSDEDEPPPPS